MKSVLPRSKLDAWLHHKLNVILIGKHGIGKTGKIKEAIKASDIGTALYFSCATLDPWVDFIGIPKEVKKGNISYLKLVRPKAFAMDEVEFIFLDELNRAKPAVQNALLELINNGSINGKKLKNLKCVWAAINPQAVKATDTQYHVEELDPAMLTRFKIRYYLPFEMDKEYFDAKHGKGVYDNLHPWWMALNENLKDEFPPRSVDYALEVLELGLDVQDSLPPDIHKTHFMRALNSGVAQAKNPIASGVTIKDVFNTMDPTKIKQLLRRNRGSLKPIISGLNNEELTKLVKMVGISSSDSLTISGKLIISGITSKQADALDKIRGAGAAAVKGAIAVERDISNFGEPENKPSGGVSKRGKKGPSSNSDDVSDEEVDAFVSGEGDADEPKKSKAAKQKWKDVSKKLKKASVKGYRPNKASARAKVF